ncbi:MAG: GDSL-type esterase/lipase family protein [Actinomycetota bacterium]
MNRMRATLRALSLSAVALALTLPALAQNLEPADVAAPKKDQAGNIQPRFQMMHESFLKRGKEGKIGVLFIGDSITQGWNGARPVWDEHFGKYDPANFGIGGDRTQHVLWRIENGELDGIAPKVVVLMIGTNNSGYPAEEILKGDRKIVEQIHAKLPKTKLLLLGIFPRGADAKAANVIAVREKLKSVNAGLAKLDDGKKTRYLDIGAKFMDAEGNLPADIMPDALHLSAKGYGIWADSIQPLLDEMMK